MSAPLGVASYVTTYSVRRPYLTAAEYQAAPSAVDASNLVQGGDQQANLYELMNVIARASSAADTFCMGIEGSLAATQDMDGPQRCRVDRFGVIKFPTRFFPVLQVDAISVGATTSTMQPITAGQAANLVIKRRGLEIPVDSMSPTRTAPGGPIAGGYGLGSHPLVQVLYVNGYATATLAASVNGGVNGIGIYPGSSLMIYDDFPGGEAITVGAGYIIGSTSVPLATPLRFKHSAGVSVCALPADVKQAVVHMTSSLIKTRGTLSIVAGKLQSAPNKTTGQSSGADKDLSAAEKLLAQFRRAR